MMANEKPEIKNTAITKSFKDVFDTVMAQVNNYQTNKQLYFPPDYSPENALKSAQLAIQSAADKNGKPALEVCTRNSVASALLDMVIQGLNPSKKQCYFIVRGNRLCLDRSYQGTAAVCKSLAGAEDVWAEVVYKGDEFEYEIRRGRKFVTKHTQKLANVDVKNIVAAYGIVDFGDKRPQYTEVMTFEQIVQAWKQGPNYKADGNGVHQKFAEEMAKKTVINRACKGYINSSNDANLQLVQQAFNREDEIQTDEEVQHEIDDNANTELLDADFTVLDDEGEPENPPAVKAPF